MKREAGDVINPFGNISKIPSYSITEHSYALKSEFTALKISW